MRRLSSAEADALKKLAAEFNRRLCNCEADIFKESLFSALILADPVYPGKIFLKFLANDAKGNFQNYKYICNLGDSEFRCVQEEDFCSLDGKSYKVLGGAKGLSRLLDAFKDVFIGVLTNIERLDNSVSFISIDLGPNISGMGNYKSCELHPSIIIPNEYNLYIKAHSDTYKDTMQLANAKDLMGKEFEQYLERTDSDTVKNMAS